MDTSLRAKHRLEVVADHQAVIKANRDLQLYKSEIRDMVGTLDSIVKRHSKVRHESPDLATTMNALILANEALRSALENI